jgi:teichoic acid transport system permease protein
MIRFLKNGWSHRRLLASLVERDITGSYSGSVLGTVWAFIDPLAYVMLTMFFFQFAIRGINTSGVPYVAWVLPQIIFWTFINSVVNASVNSIKEYSFLLRHKNFEMRLIAIIKLLSGLVIHVFLITIVLLILYGFLGIQCGLATFGMLYYLFCMCLLLVAMAWIISSVGAFWKDIKNIVSIVMQVEFWISPIFWNADRFPKPIALIMYANPFYYPMHGYRQAIIMGSFGSTFVVMTVYFWLLLAVFLFFGSHLFGRLSRHFGDVV